MKECEEEIKGGRKRRVSQTGRLLHKIYFIGNSSPGKKHHTKYSDTCGSEMKLRTVVFVLSTKI